MGKRNDRIVPKQDLWYQKFLHRHMKLPIMFVHERLLEDIVSLLQLATYSLRKPNMPMSLLRLCGIVNLALTFLFLWLLLLDMPRHASCLK